MTSGESGRTAVSREGGDSEDGSGWYGSCKILIKMRNIHTARTQSAKLNGAGVNRNDTGTGEWNGGSSVKQQQLQQRIIIINNML